MSLIKHRSQWPRVSVETVMIMALLFMVRPVRSETDYSDQQVRRYRVVDLEARGENSIKISPGIENIAEYDTIIVVSDKLGRPLYCMERVEKTLEGDKFYWKHYLDPQTMSLVRIEKKSVSRSGATVSEQWFDYLDPMFDFPGKLCHVYTITALLRTMDLKAGFTDDINLLLNFDSAPWHMFIVVEAEEKVTVPSGTYDCYKVRLDPDYSSIMGKWSWTSPLIKRFVPEYYFWVEKQFPHALIRFQGTFGPVGGSPPQAHELTKILSDKQIQ